MSYSVNWYNKQDSKLYKKTFKTKTEAQRYYIAKKRSPRSTYVELNCVNKRLVFWDELHKRK